jgi:endoglucanase
VTTNVLMPKGIYTLRMRVIDGNFNMNWMEFEVDNVVNNDVDNDGVLNEEDQCPNTKEGAKVNVVGCEIFSLPIDNFNLRLFSETCKSSNNGEISITAKENYHYTASLTGNESLLKVRQFTSQTASFEDLEAGDYTLCIKIEEEPEYEQCFELVVAEPEDLAVLSKINKKATKVTLSLKGSESYLITFNEKFIRTSESEITLDLVQSKNTISVKTNNDCQGIYEETIIMTNDPIVYPNPVQGNKLFINTGNLSETSVAIEIFNLAGNLVSSTAHPINRGVLEIDISNLAKGMYILKIATSNDTFNYKIIRQ